MKLGDLDDSARQSLSALVDGEVDAAASADVCSAWAQDDRLRADWHTWHLIGDVLRSEDLASDPRADRRLSETITARLRSEAVVLAPGRVESRAGAVGGAMKAMPAQGRRSGRGRWAAGGAIAAGLVLVAGSFTLLQSPEITSSDRLASTDAVAPARLASTAPVTAGVAAARTPTVETAAPPPALVADGKWIRDARLDGYLEAHKQVAGTSVLGVPSAFLRSATLDSPAR
jgi:sigma-E factor negative regulatory protein RseA